MLSNNMGNYPWLADSWPTTNLVHNGKDSVNCCTSKHDSTERYYNGESSVTFLITLVSVSDIKNLCSCSFGQHLPLSSSEAGISNYLSQTEKYGTGSTEGPIYSTIDPTSEDLRNFNAPYSQHTTPYASTPVMPYSGQVPCSPDQETNHWMIQPGPSGAQYAQPDRSRTENGRPNWFSCYQVCCVPTFFSIKQC